MSAVVYLGEATLASTSPLTVKMPLAAVAQPATALGGALPALNSTVIVVVRDDGTTYLLGPPAPGLTPTGQNLYLTSPSGSVYQLQVTDAGVLGTRGPL